MRRAYVYMPPSAIVVFMYHMSSLPARESGDTHVSTKEVPMGGHLGSTTSKAARAWPAEVDAHGAWPAAVDAHGRQGLPGADADIVAGPKT